MQERNGWTSLKQLNWVVEWYKGVFDAVHEETGTLSLWNVVDVSKPLYCEVTYESSPAEQIFGRIFYTHEGRH